MSCQLWAIRSGQKPKVQSRRPKRRRLSSWRLAAVLVGAVPDHGAVRRGVEDLAVEHAAVFEGHVQLIAVLGRRAAIEGHNTGVPTRADLNSIWQQAEIARTTFD